MSLPDTYTRLKYIKVKDKAIDTEWSVDRTAPLTVEVRAAILGGENQQRIFGVIDDYYSCDTWGMYINAGGLWAYTDAQSGSQWTSTGVYRDAEYHFFKLETKYTSETEVSTKCIVDSWESDTRTYTPSSNSGLYLYIFGNPHYTTSPTSPSTVDLYAYGLFYGAKIYQSTEVSTMTLVGDYIPVRCDEDGSIGFYDLVNDVYTQGTGPGYLIAGPVEGEVVDERELTRAEYELEVWDWRNDSYITNIGYIVKGGINISWTLNDVESLDFEIDLVQFEKRCAELGVSPFDVLTPYVHDVRVKRNGEYILGCQVVEANINISNNENATIQVRCTGFLNLFKDRYISEPISGYTYPEIAGLLVERSQQGVPIIKNATGDIDASYWMATSGCYIRHYTGSRAHSGAGCIAINRSSATTGWTVGGTQMTINAGDTVHVSVWVSGQSGQPIYVREREYLTISSNQVTLASYTPSVTDQMYQMEFEFIASWTNGYIIFETNRTTTTTEVFVDDCWVVKKSDEDALMDLGVTVGVNNTDAVINTTRTMNYELQNVKDAIMGLTRLEEDNFDFEFEYDRTFNLLNSKGWRNVNAMLKYPGNIDSLTISRSASDLVNRITNIGSGIGDQRLEVVSSNTASRARYGTRESFVTNNNVSLVSTLQAQADGQLEQKKNLTNLPTITVGDGSINPSNLKVGDTVPIVISNDDEYIQSIEGFHRVLGMQVNVSSEGKEDVSITVEPNTSPETGAKKIRYIKDYTYGNTVDGQGRYNQWVEVEAIRLNGSEEENVALGATVIGCNSGSRTYVYPEKVTNGNTASDDYCYCDDSGGGAVLIDLGAEYEVDYIRVWHLWSDGRTFYGNTLSVGTEYDDSLDPLETVLWQYDDDEAAWAETSAGHRSDLIYFE